MRKDPRRKFEVEGTLSSLTEGVQHPDYRVLINNISAAGVYLLTDTALVEVGEQVKLQLRLPEKSQMRGPADLFGTVVRTERLSDEKVGVAIRFSGASRFNFD